MWETGTDRYLIAAHDVDLTDQDTRSEINRVNPALDNAIAHDVAQEGGGAEAQQIDAQLGSGEDAQDVMRLLLIASLAAVPNAVRGLTIPEIVSYLCAPGRNVAHVREVIDRLCTSAWYLHQGARGRLFLRRVENLTARVRTTAQNMSRDHALKELRERLGEVFSPGQKRCYQRIQVLPPVDEISLGRDQVTLIVTEPVVQSHSSVNKWGGASLGKPTSYRLTSRSTMTKPLIATEPVFSRVLERLGKPSRIAHET